MDQDHIDKAIVENYQTLRNRMGLLTAAFPVVVILVGLAWGIQLQPSLSDYYFAQNPASGMADLYPVRLWFCGLLFAVGVFLYRYKGFSKNEDRWLSLTGAFTLCVAIFPMAVSGKTSPFTLAYFGYPNVTLHGISAVLAFVCIGIIIFWFSGSTLSKLKKDGAARKWFRRARTRSGKSRATQCRWAQPTSRRRCRAQFEQSAPLLIGRCPAAGIFRRIRRPKYPGPDLLPLLC
jgi:hypothetical protein